MTKYNEIIRLHDMLDSADIPHDFEKAFDGYRICYNRGKQTVCSVIEHCHSYGSESNLLEIMGLLTPAESVQDDVAGWLTADDVFNRIFSAHRVAESTRCTYEAVDCSINGAGGGVWEGFMPSWD